MIEKDFLFLVTARAGSKGIPDKNILRFGETTALSLRVKVIRECHFESSDIICSTDSSLYAEIARDSGAQAPFLRPQFLASDEASSIDVVLHALNWLEINENCRYRYVVLIEPSSPFCRKSDLIEGINLLKKYEDPVVAVRMVDVDPIFIAPLGEAGEFPELGARIACRSKLRRQDFRAQYTPCGAFYGALAEDFKRNRTFYSEMTRAFVIPEPYSIELDSPAQAEFAQYLWNRQKIMLD